jgi:hypothetical protein
LFDGLFQNPDGFGKASGDWKAGVHIPPNLWFENRRFELAPRFFIIIPFFPGVKKKSRSEKSQLNKQ